MEETMQVTWRVSLIGVASMLLGGSTAIAQNPTNYVFVPKKIYRMPTHFGPATGPRQGEDGKKFANKGVPKTKRIEVRFLTERDKLARLLPAGFSVGAEPVVTVFAAYTTEIEWLAGRGYNVLGVTFPAVYAGKQDRAKGDFLLVLWENLTDPILTGREELGFAKIYADLPEPRVYQGETHAYASWMGFRFLDIDLKNMTQVTLNQTAAREADPESEELTGLLHYKYFPKTGDWGEADVAYPVITPSGGGNGVLHELWRGEGTVAFHRARWEDLPTQFQIVNAFAELPIKECRGASISVSTGGKDLSDQRILR
jgi:hypothetical protein